MPNPTSSTDLPTVLLIGAAGLLGRAVAASLARESSLNLVATIRNPQGTGAKRLALPRKTSPNSTSSTSRPSNTSSPSANRPP